MRGKHDHSFAGINSCPPVVWCKNESAQDLLITFADEVTSELIEESMRYYQQLCP